MSLNITRRLGEGFILRNKAKNILRPQGLVRLELQQKVRNKNGVFYQVSVNSNTDSVVLKTTNEEVLITKNERLIINVAPNQLLYVTDEKGAWLDSSITFEASSGSQVKVSIDALMSVNIVRDELLERAA